MKQWTLWEEKNLGEELKNRAAQMDSLKLMALFWWNGMRR